MIQLECLASAAHLWHASGRGCLAEHMLFTDRRGASTVIGSTSFTAPEGQRTLALGTLERLKSDGLTVGEAFRQAQAALALEDGDQEVLESFILLGDPAAR